MRDAGRVTLWVALGIGTLLGPSGQPPAGIEADPGLTRHITGLLTAREYEASWQERGLQAPNRAQNLRIWFEPSGIRVHDRTAPGSPELLALHLASVGRRARSQPVGAGRLAADGPRVEIRRPGVVEWYENRPDGLEQGFTLESRPTGEGEVVVDLRVRGAAIQMRGDSVDLVTERARRLRYGDLVAWDAGGERLAARLEAGERSLRIAVDDTRARYPLTIDPLLAEASDGAIEANQAGALLASSVAGAGDIDGDGYGDVIVGAPGYDAGEVDEGAAFIFLGSAAGIESGDAAAADARLESNQAGAGFGVGVAGAGDVNGDGYADVIVAADLYDAGQSDEGAAFVFHGGPDGIVGRGPSTAAAQLESDRAYASFGGSSNYHGSVGSAGDVNGDGYADVIVGAPSYDAGQIGEGAAFVFLGSAAGIADAGAAAAAAILEANQAGAGLGTSVAGAGDVNEDGYADVIVGVPYYTSTQTGEGAAFVFHGGAGGIASGSPATAQGRIVSGQAFAQLGASVAGAGDVDGDGSADVVVGAPDYDAGETNEGAAFVFHGGFGGIGNRSAGYPDARLESDVGTSRMGESVAGAGDVNGDGRGDVAVGAPQLESGAVLVFFGGVGGVGNGNPANRDRLLQAGSPGSQLGWSVAGAGDVNGDGLGDLIAGAWRHTAGQSNEGAAFVLHGAAYGTGYSEPTSAAAQFELNQGDALGRGLSAVGVGDVNGDSLADIAVGAPAYDQGQIDEGTVLLFYGIVGGIPGGNPATAATRIESDRAYAQLGSSVAAAGDVNGDGFADIIAGAPNDSSGQGGGAAFIFHGGPGGVASGNLSVAATRIESDLAEAVLGISVAGAGDVDGDGYADVVVGARNYGYAGAAFLFRGRTGGIPDGTAADADTRILSDQSAALLGDSVSSAGDVDGDGFADIVIGARGYGPGGEAWIFHGGPLGIASGGPAAAATRIESGEEGAALGSCVASAGDVNGDGYADVVVGVPGFGESDAGAAYLFHGGPSGIQSGDPSSAAARIEGSHNGGRLGASLAGAGDVNGDGFADVIVGEPVTGTTEPGAAYLFYGSPDGIPDAPGGDPVPADMIAGNVASMGLGTRVAGAGDMDGDGFGEVLVGAAHYDTGGDDAVSFVFRGNRNVKGRVGRAVSFRVPAWGVPPQVDRINLGAEISHPWGLGAVSVEAEACPAAQPASGPCLRATRPFLAVGGDGTAYLGLTVSGLSPGTLYRWRIRALHAPLAVTRPGIQPPPHPAHGPWRRLNAQLIEADFRTDTDADSDGVGGRRDNCPYHASRDTTDTDTDGRGNPCECTDQDDDGRNTASDLVAINAAIFDPGLVTPLCDGNGDGKCNVADIIAANFEIYSPGNTSICARQPVPGP